MSRGAAASTDVGASEAAREVLEAWGGTADALVAGWFALAGTHPEGLFAPIVALVAGPGAGARFFDGRALQPGLGLARPRGFNHGESIPDAALAAVPRSPFAMALLHSQRGRLPFGRLADAGVVRAKDAGADARAEMLKRVAAEGPTALQRERVQNALLAAAGPLARGTLTPEDLSSIRAEERPAVTDTIEEATLVTPGPVADLASQGPAPTAKLHAISVVDAQGVAGCLVAWLEAPGVLVPDLEVALPSCAAPVRRGVPRAKPGEVIAIPAPLAIVERAEVRLAIAGIRAGSVVLEDLVAVAADPTLDTGLARLAARGGSIVVVSEPRGGRVAIGAAI